MRYYYRKFLTLCRKHGLEPESEMVTTEMMRTIAAESWGDEESVDEFTNLYRDVRYGDRKDEESERKTAKALFKTLKGLADSKKSHNKNKSIFGRMNDVSYSQVCSFLM